MRQFIRHACDPVPMRLTRVYHPAALEPGSLVELPRPIAEHLVRVLRARPGDEFVLFSGDGRECSATLVEVRGLRVTATIGAARIVDRESPLAITLYQCVARGDRMDFIVQKARSEEHTSELQSRRDLV